MYVHISVFSLDKIECMQLVIRWFVFCFNRVNNDANGNVEDGNETEGEVLVNGERLASSSSSSGNGLGARPKVRPSTSQQPHHQPGTVQLPSQESFQVGHMTEVVCRICSPLSLFYPNL